MFKAPSHSPAKEDKRTTIQREAIEQVRSLHRAGLGISMGVGKTYIGLQHMQLQLEENPSARFLVVAPKVAIYQSWKDDAASFHLEHLLPHITFTTYRSLPKQSRDFDVLYLDECHSLLYTHDFYLSTYGGKILGLTGTPPRFKNSEKGEMVEKYCPIVYTYVTDSAVEDQILNDYKIIVHCLELNTAKTHKVTNKKGGFFMTSEKANYDYWSERLAGAVFSSTQQQIFRIMRMQALMKFDTKEHYAKNLLSMMDEKCIVFCNTTEQADRICPNSYHTKNPYRDNSLVKFKKGEINCLSAVQQLNEGINIPNLRYGIILHAYSNERKSSQRIGRLLRLSPDQRATIHILMYQNTVDEEWVRSALKDLDPEKIQYVTPYL